MRLYPKKLIKDILHDKNFKHLRKEIDFYGKCPNCGVILQEFDSECLF